MKCDLCGKEAELYKTKIEKTVLDVCDNCKKFGQVLEKVRTTAEIYEAQKVRKSSKEVQEQVVSDYALKIKNAREQLGLSQEDFALKINVKKSLLQSIESGRIELSLDLAKKLEKILKITLTEEDRNDYRPPDITESPGFTIGDILKDKRKK